MNTTTIHIILLFFSMSVTSLSCMKSKEAEPSNAALCGTNHVPFSNDSPTTAASEETDEGEDEITILLEKPSCLSQEQKKELQEQEPDFLLINRLALFAALNFLGNKAIALSNATNNDNDYQWLIRKIKFNKAFKSHNLTYEVTDLSDFFLKNPEKPWAIFHVLLNALEAIQEKFVAIMQQSALKPILLLSPTKTSFDLSDIECLDSYLLNSPKSPIQQFIKYTNDSYLVTIRIKNILDTNNDIVCTVFLKRDI